MLNDTSTVDQANHLMWAAHNLERMSDRVTNICERTIYVATGQLLEVDSIRRRIDQAAEEVRTELT